jgi:glutathione S-transferase
MAAMSVVLYQMAHSPFCIPISQAMLSCGVRFEVREVPNWDRTEILRMTGGAYYAVPFLLHDGRPILESSPDSQDIARHVDATWAGGRLFPARDEAANISIIEFLENEVEARTFKLVDIHYIPGIADLAHRGMVVRHKERKFGRGCVEAWRRSADSLRAEADALLSRFEMTLRGRPFVLGDSPVYADFLLFGILASFTMNGWNEFSSEQRALSEWFGRMKAFRW